MAAISDIIKSMIDKQTISKNKWLIMWILTALSGASGSIAQTLRLTEAGETNTSMKEHIEYTNKNYVLPNAVIEKTTTPKIVVRTSSCGDCKSLKQDIEKLKRWHE